ncbi:MAG: glycosyltransferase, partial [Ignavibacteriales bacterium]|nr:glycosyltransferase [Ignavibacteriales bacterium]
IIAVSKGEFSDLGKNKICKKSKLAQINNGIKLQNSSAYFPNENQKFRIVTITRFDYQKNTEMLVDIIREMNNNEFEFVIIGTGKNENQIKTEIDKLNSKSNVIFTGGVTNTQDILKDCHCYISTSRWEGLPLAVLEAMANGLPVVATNVVGNKDILIHNQNGFLFNISNHKEAVEYISMLANEKTLWERISNAAKNSVKDNFSLEQMIKKTKNIYEIILIK